MKNVVILDYSEYQEMIDKIEEQTEEIRGLKEHLATMLEVRRIIEERSKPF